MAEISPEYAAYLLSDHWKELKARKKASVRKVRCEVCTSPRRIHVHHLQYRSLHDVQLGDLRLVCERCHTVIHDLIRAKVVNPYRHKSSSARWQVTRAGVVAHLAGLRPKTKVVPPKKESAARPPSKERKAVSRAESVQLVRSKVRKYGMTAEEVFGPPPVPPAGRQ